MTSGRAPERHIVAMGGAAADAMLDYVLALARGTRVLYVPTAGKEDPARTLEWYERLRGRAEVRHLHFFPWPPPEVRATALEHDVILVGGGNTANMLAVWRVHGFDRVLRDAWEAGIVLCGWSAGMICWFEAGVTDSFGPDLAPLHDGLGFLPGSACPHYDGEERRRPVYSALVREGFPPGYAADDAAGLHFVGADLAEVVSAREGSTAYRVDAAGETPLHARLL